MSLSTRHSSHNREPTPGSKSEARHAAQGGQTPTLTHDEAERLASKIVDKGSGYISRKTEGRFDAETDVSVGTGNFLPVHAMANKLMKEGAREMEREAGTVAKGSDAAMAQSVYWHKDDVASPQHEVAEKIVERVAAAEEHEVHGTFVGVDPGAGAHHNAKLRHFQPGHGPPVAPYVSTALKDERNPDIVPKD